MPNGVHKKNVDLPIEPIWEFIRDMNNWAPLVPGYINHEILNDKQSTWTFRGKVKGIEKTISVGVDITEWQEPNKVTFTLTGLNEKIEGNGYFTAETKSRTRTLMTGYLDITAKGIKAPFYNVVLTKLVPRTARQLSEAVVKEMVGALRSE